MGKKDKTAFVTCMTCKWANLISYRDNDPLIAECTKCYDTYFEQYVRDVASAKRFCDLYERSLSRKKIIKKN